MAGSFSDYTYSPSIDLLHEPIDRQIVVNRWRLQLELQSMRDEFDRPSLEDAFPWLGVFLAFLLPLVSSDFRSFLSISGEVWNAAVLIGAAISGLRAAGIGWEVWRRRNEPRISAEQVVDKIIEGGD